MDEWNKLNSTRKGAQPALTLPRDHDADNFAVLLTGFIKIEKDGIYTFYTTSDDGSTLYIGDTLVVDNDAAHAAQEKSGQIALAAGYHPIRVKYFELDGDESLSVAYEGPGLTKQNIPASVLFHQAD